MILQRQSRIRSSTVWSSQSDAGEVPSCWWWLLYYFFSFLRVRASVTFWLDLLLHDWSPILTVDGNSLTRTWKRTERNQSKVDLRLDPSIWYTIYIQQCILWYTMYTLYTYICYVYCMYSVYSIRVSTRHPFKHNPNQHDRMCRTGGNVRNKQRKEG